MVKPREGYHTMVVQIPVVLWEDLTKDAERQRMSATQLLIRLLAQRYKRGPDELPAPRRAGRKPKERPR
jgi:hypothetical protein